MPQPLRFTTCSWCGQPIAADDAIAIDPYPVGDNNVCHLACAAASQATAVRRREARLQRERRAAPHLLSACKAALPLVMDEKVQDQLQKAIVAAEGSEDESWEAQ